MRPLCCTRRSPHPHRRRMLIAHSAAALGAWSQWTGGLGNNLTTTTINPVRLTVTSSQLLLLLLLLLSLSLWLLLSQLLLLSFLLLLIVIVIIIITIIIINGSPSKSIASTWNKIAGGKHSNTWQTRAADPPCDVSSFYSMMRTITQTKRPKIAVCCFIFSLLYISWSQNGNIYLFIKLNDTVSTVRENKEPTPRGLSFKRQDYRLESTGWCIIKFRHPPKVAIHQRKMQIRKAGDGRQFTLCSQHGQLIRAFAIVFEGQLAKNTENASNTTNANSTAVVIEPCGHPSHEPEMPTFHPLSAC